MDHKEARLGDVDDSMDVDDSSSPKPATAATVTISLKPDHGMPDRDIVVALRPFVLEINTYNSKDLAPLCADLNQLRFLQRSFGNATKDEILFELGNIYFDAISREAANLTVHGDDGLADIKAARVAAIEMRNAILHSELQGISEPEGGSSRMKVYRGRVPDVQNPGELTSVIVRPEDEAFWGKCIELSLQNHPVCAVGNAGIGKTTTTIYLLQRLVMELKQPVVYTIRKADRGGNIFYEFVPVIENNASALVQDIHATVYKMNVGEKARIPSMMKNGAYYVVDPGKFKESCVDTDELYEANFIMAGSNDQRHWGGNDFTKSRQPSNPSTILRHRSKVLKKGELVYGSLWTGHQVIDAKPYLSTLRDLGDDEVLSRCRIVGGSLRDILFFDETKFKDDVEQAMGTLNQATVRALAEGIYPFAFQPESQSSILIAVSPHEQDLKRYKITLKTDYIEERLASTYLKNSWFELLDEDNAGNRGNLFESYLRLKFSTSTVVFSIEDARESLRTWPSGSKKLRKNYHAVATEIRVGSRRTVVRVRNLAESVRLDQTQETLYYSKNEREELIDMIFRVDGGYDAIQSTISKDHTAHPVKIRKLKADLQLQDSMKLRIFFAVPRCRYQEFETNPVNPLLEEHGLSNVFIYHVGVSADE